MPKTIEEYKKQEIIGFDVWLDSGVCMLMALGRV